MRGRKILCALLGACLFSGLFFVWKLTRDNKYDLPSPQARDGFLRLDGGAPDVVILRDGWAFYQYKALDPTQLAEGNYQPTHILSLGRYGGFNLDDAKARPNGAGTYRLIILTDGTPRRYMLELPEVYTRYRLYINGALKWSVGEPGTVTTQQARVTFEAVESIDLMFAVESDGFWSSGLTSPPAFGDPVAVGRLLDTRLMLSAAACTLALVTALLHLVIGLRACRANLALAYGLLCASFVLCVGRIPVHTLALPGLFWYRLEALGNCGLILALLLTHGQVCAVSQRLRRAVSTLGVLFCALAFLGPIPAISHGEPSLLLLSVVLDLYRWGAALWLLLSTVWYARKGPPKVLALACGYVIFGAALLTDRLVPLYEPILVFWPIEAAGFLLVLILSGILGADALSAFREAASAKAEAQLYARLEAVQQRQYHQLCAHSEELHRLRHELRSQLMAYQRLLDLGRYGDLSNDLNAAIGLTSHAYGYSGNPEVNAILATFLTELEGTGVKLQLEITSLPEALPIKPLDLYSLLLNILENAKDACLRLQDGRPEVIQFSMCISGSKLLVTCSNPFQGVLLREGGHFQTTKANPRSHGFGSKQIGSIVKKYGGTWYTNESNESFQLYLVIPL